MKTLLLLLLIMPMALSCRKAVFEPDKTDPRLPAYTEKGNQIGGALINNVAWQTDYTGPRGEAGTHDVFFITSYPVGDSTKIQLLGEINEGKNKGSTVALNFVLGQLQIRSPGQVPGLSGRTFILDGKKNYSVLEDYQGIYGTNKRGITRYPNGTGELVIKRVKEQTNVTINSGPGISYHPCIVSGIFSTTIVKDTSTFKVTEGRFDFVYP